MHIRYGNQLTISHDSIKEPKSHKWYFIEGSLIQNPLVNQSKVNKVRNNQTIDQVKLVMNKLATKSD